METLKRWWQQVLVWFGFGSEIDLLKYIAQQLVTKEVYDIIVKTVIEVASSNKTGAEKKAFVMNELQKVKGELGLNIRRLGNQVLSRAVNLVVEQLQMDGTLPPGKS